MEGLVFEVHVANVKRESINENGKSDPNVTVFEKAPFSYIQGTHNEVNLSYVPLLLVSVLKKETTNSFNLGFLSLLTSASSQPF